MVHGAWWDLSVDLADDGVGLTAGFTYATRLFRPETIVRLADRFVGLLEAITSDSNASLSSLGEYIAARARREIAVESP
jgi:hypothetical protein